MDLLTTVEKPLFVVFKGKLIERKDNGNGNFHWKMDVPQANYLTSIVVGACQILHCQLIETT